jgi:hypothetical protein
MSTLPSQGVVHALRINIQSLSNEARVNRREVKRARDPEVKNSLATHRRVTVRQEARLAHLALAFVRGRPYKRVENKVRENNEPNPGRLVRKINRFVTAPVTPAMVVDWLTG